MIIPRNTKAYLVYLSIIGVYFHYKYKLIFKRSIFSCIELNELLITIRYIIFELVSLFCRFSDSTRIDDFKIATNINLLELRKDIFNLFRSSLLSWFFFFSNLILDHYFASKYFLIHDA
jgi:hypothetical protein